MNCSGMRFAGVAWLVCIGAPALAVPLNANFAVTADDSNGRSFDADIALAPNKHFTFNAGAGYSSGTDDSNDLRGTLLNVGASLHSDRGGVSLDYHRFEDGSDYTAATFGARVWLDAGDFEIALLGRQRAMNVQVTLALPLRTVSRDADFSAIGGGLQVGYSHGNFSAYAMGLSYDYDAGFDRFLELAASPQLTRRPLIEALVGSFVTQAQGVIDSQAGAGVEWGFGRESLALDFSRVHDAISNGSSTSVAVTWRHTQSAHLDYSIAGGLVDSARYGNTGFVSIALGLNN